MMPRRDLFPHGVASGDPDTTSVVLWTRRPPVDGNAARALRVEVAIDRDFQHLVFTGHAPIAEAGDWTCQILASGLHAGREYWYRFVDEHGFASRVGRTLTAPDDERPVSFAFVSCQNVQQGAQTAYR